MSSLFPTPLDTTEPSGIDEVLAELWGQYYQAMDTVTIVRRDLDEVNRRLARPQNGSYRSYGQHHDLEERPRLERRIADLLAEGDVILAAGRPGEDEYRRRGGWNRAFLVTNNGGHIHSTRGCSTCYPTTRFIWVTTLSGTSEDHIVNLAGRGACTVCYPSAPVETRTALMRIEDPVAAAARTERAAAKETRDATKAVKAIANPDGTPLRLPSYGTIATERSAEIEYVRLGVYVLGLAGRDRDDLVASYSAQMDLLRAALAHKRGQMPEQITTSLAIKIERKFRKENR